MKVPLTSMIGILGIVSVGCSTPSFFPPEATRDVTALEFGVLEAKPDVFKGRVVQLAGRIVGVEQSADGILIRAQELPIHPHRERVAGGHGGAVLRLALLHATLVDQQVGQVEVALPPAGGDQSAISGGRLVAFVQGVKLLIAQTFDAIGGGY